MSRQNDKPDSGAVAEAKPNEKAVLEASAAKPEMVEGIRKALDALKRGATSGITREFGKPLIADLTTGPTKEASNRIYRTGELPRLKTNLTQENKKPLLKNPGTESGSHQGHSSHEPSEAGIKPELAANKTVGATNAEHAAHKPVEVSIKPEHAANKPVEASIKSEHAVNKPVETSIKSEHAAHKPVEASIKAEHAAHQPAGAIKAADTVYLGELIQRDLPLGLHKVAQGETLEQVARQHLGSAASVQEINLHMREIERINHLHSHHLHPGWDLKLPGHTADGGFVTKDASGYTHTLWQDRTHRVESRDGHGYVRKTAHDGSYTEQHWGKNPHENYLIARGADGRYLLTEKPGDIPKEATAHDTRVAHAKLNDLAIQKITNQADLARFQASMDQFESRVRKQHMPLNEISRTYQQLEKLLQHKGHHPLSGDQTKAIAQQIMHQAANPTKIDQGQHNTCNVTVVESRLYTRDPAEAARLVTEVALEGRFIARDGTIVKCPENSIKPDKEAAKNPPGYSERSHASQLFQVTALNLYHQTEAFQYTDKHGRAHYVPPGGMRYEQTRRRSGRTEDTGERLIDTTTNPPVTIAKSPDITDDAIGRLNNKLTGEVGHTVIIDHKDDVYGDKSSVTTVANERDLTASLAKAAHDGKLPVIVRVHTDNEPWLHDSGAGDAGGSGGAHVVSVIAFEPATTDSPAHVEVDNQWGDKDDHIGSKRLSVHDLYLSLRPADNSSQYRQLKHDVEWDRAHGSVDTRKEFELLRLMRKLPDSDPDALSEKQFARKVEAQIDAAGQRWTQQRANGSFNEFEYLNAMQKLSDISTVQEIETRFEWIARSHRVGAISDQTFDRSLSAAMHKAKKEWAWEDRHNCGDPAERHRVKHLLERILSSIPPERQQAILANSKR